MRLKPILAGLLAIACAANLACTSAPAPSPSASPDAAPTVIEARPDEPDAAQSTAPAAIASTPVTPADPDALRVLFINVGKADAILVQVDGANALIDTGTKESAPQLLGALNGMGVDALDALFLTHTHNDHIGGMRALCLNLPVRQAYMAEFSESKKNGENKIVERAAECGVPLTRLSAGETVALSGDAAFSVLGPLAYDADDDNDNSLVLRLSFNGRTLLLTGDMQFAEEDTLLAAGATLNADVLKVGNHGNPDATGEAFAAAVAPSLAVLSTDTAVDTDSANPRVYAALAGADVHVTQDYQTGVLLTVAPDGAMALGDPVPPATELRLTVREQDVSKQTVTIQNDGAAADIGGCMLLSERGGELFRFPAGAQLQAGAVVTVSGTGGGGDYEFSGEPAPWHKSKDDAALLFDPYGRALPRG